MAEPKNLKELAKMYDRFNPKNVLTDIMLIITHRMKELNEEINQTHPAVHGLLNKGERPYLIPEETKWNRENVRDILLLKEKTARWEELRKLLGEEDLK